MKNIDVLKLCKINFYQNSYIVVLFFSLFFSHYVAAKNIKAHLDNLNPFAYEIEGKYRGVLVEWLELITQESNLSFDVTLVPTVRIGMNLESGAADIGFRTKVTIKDLLPIAQVHTTTLVTFSLKENRINSLTDLYGKTACVLIGGSYGKAFDTNEHINKYPVSTYRQMLQMVMKKRCYAGMGFRRALEYRIQALGYDLAEFAQPFTVHYVPLYLAVSKKNANEEFVSKIRKAAQVLKAKGAFKMVLDNYEIIDSNR